MDEFNTAAEQCYNITKSSTITTPEVVIATYEKFYDRFNIILNDKVNGFNSVFQTNTDILDSMQLHFHRTNVSSPELII